jgi:hypothetical protein
MNEANLSISFGKGMHDLLEKLEDISEMSLEKLLTNLIIKFIRDNKKNVEKQVKLTESQEELLKLLFKINLLI